MNIKSLPWRKTQTTNHNKTTTKPQQTTNHKPQQNRITTLPWILKIGNISHNALTFIYECISVPGNKYIISYHVEDQKSSIFVIVAPNNLNWIIWLGLAWLGLAWLGLAWLGLAWLVIRHEQGCRDRPGWINIIV
jgi:hypothetical protein